MMRMAHDEVELHCARNPLPSNPAAQRRCLELVEVWPLWEATCRERPTWMLRAQNQGVLIVARRSGGDLVVVPSGSPADAMRRAFLMTR